MSRPHRLRGLALAALVLAGAACSASGGTEGAGPEPTALPRQPAPAAPGPAGATRPLPPAPALPTAPPDLPPPTELTIGSLGVDGAPVVPVGVEPDGDMEIPGPQEVGWYRHGPRPGDDGSAVLAAHIAYDGVDGVFRHLDDVRPGAAVTVDLGDGATREFVVTAVERYPKQALPDEVFARGGDAGLVLITCGGRFDAAARSYEDNVVAFARPA